MATIQIQNHELPIAFGKFKNQPEVVGDRKLTFSGKPISTRRSIKNVWTATTKPVSKAYADFLVSLLYGEGHRLSFDDATYFRYTSKGLGPVSANGSRNTSGSKFGTASLTLGAGITMSWAAGYHYDWTLMVWKGADATWTSETHYIVNSDGQKWVDGVRNDGASTPFLSVNGSGQAVLGDSGAGAAQYFDDFVFFPSIITAEWAEDFGTMAVAFGDLPKLKVSGQLLGALYNAEGYDIDTSYTQGMVDGTWTNLVEVSFTLREFDRIS